METQRRYRYTGEPMLTRGEYGVRIEGGHTTEDDPDGIYSFDPDFGDRFICTLERADEFGFVEIDEPEA